MQNHSFTRHSGHEHDIDEGQTSTPHTAMCSRTSATRSFQREGHNSIPEPTICCNHAQHPVPAQLLCCAQATSNSPWTQASHQAGRTWPPCHVSQCLHNQPFEASTRAQRRGGPGAAASEPVKRERKEASGRPAQRLHMWEQPHGPCKAIGTEQADTRQLLQSSHPRPATFVGSPTQMLCPHQTCMRHHTPPQHSLLIVHIPVAA